LKLRPVLVEDPEDEKPKKPFELPSGLELLHKCWQDSEWATKAKEYLEGRGIDLDLIRQKKVLFTETGRYSHRVIFPVIWQKKIVGMVCRAILKSQKPRYLNSTGDKYIWNIPKTPKDKVILCEGVTKGIALEKCFDDQFSIGAILGHTITGTQIEQLDGAKEVILFPDPDPAGIRGAIKVAYKLRNRFHVFLPLRIPTQQADEMSPEDVLTVCTSIQFFGDSMKCYYESAATRREHNAE